VHSKSNRGSLASSPLRAGRHWARLTGVVHTHQRVGLLSLRLARFEYRASGRSVSLTVTDGGTAYYQHLRALLGRQPTAREAQAPEIFLQHERCWLDLAQRHGSNVIVGCRPP
jgi:hypothetical protein